MAVISIQRTDLETGDQPTIPEGRWLAQILSNSYSDGKAYIRYRLLDGPDKAFVGTIGVQSYPLEGGNERRMIIPFITRFGLRERGSSTEDLGDFDLDEVNGREVIFDIVHDVQSRKKGTGTITYCNWNCNNVWPADDPRAGDLARVKKPSKLQSNGAAKHPANPLAGVVSSATADDDDF